ncbi:MAG: formate dehydrogenase subunit alpha [Gammaproteobacteria bacterium]|nr:formate dehydrogenase subunit alpha [Gammaproteobacteria bacterium]
MTAYIDGQPFEIEPGETIYDFVCRCRDSSVIPVLCHDPVIEPFGACRLCTVEVASEAAGSRRIQAACHTPVTEGMWVYPASERVERLRRQILELLVSDFPDDRRHPAKGEIATPFQALLARYAISQSRYPAEGTDGELDLSHPYIHFDASECINCYRCVRVCDEVQGEMVLAMHGRGHESRIIRSLNQTFADSDCVSCGRCVQSCPTNALSDRYRVKSRQVEKRVRTVCTYCGVGCNLEVLVDKGEIKGIQGVEGAAVNRGHTCVKGRYAFEYYNHPDRLRSPLVRKDGVLTAVSWDEALDLIASRLSEIRTSHGPDAIAGISSARCTNEENYLMQKFLRAVIGSNNVDGCARVCHAPTAYGMQQVFGTGAATNSIDEIDQTECLLVIGANPTDAHPVTGARIRQRAMQGVPLIVIDPRVTTLAARADFHLQLNPGTNVALLEMMLFYLLSEGWIDQGFVDRRTEGFEAFREQVLQVDLAQLEKITGVERTLVRDAVHCYAWAERSMCFHGLGVTEHYQGSRSVMLISALAMITGNIGRPGVGINPLRGQNNVQGAADMGVQPNLGAGYLDLTDPDVSAHYRKHYGVEVPTTVGYRIPEMFQAAREGKLKAMWVMGEDMMQTDPNSCCVKRALEQLDLLIVQELFMTETASMADVVLPASSHFEKSGTFTNGERRVQRVNQVVDPLEGTRPDGQIMVDIMNRMGYEQPGYDPALHLQEISRVVPFFAGISWANLEGDGKQWPVAADGTDTKILHQQAFKIGRGQFKFYPFEQTPELNDREGYPFILTTGRLLEHYNCGTMTRRTPNREIVDSDFLLINSEDATTHGLNSGDRVKVSSRQGTTHLVAEVSSQVKPGVLFTTFHFPEIAINQITSDVTDIESMTPEYKVVAVRIDSY